MNGHHVSLGDEKVNGLVSIGKRGCLARQEVAQLLAAANLRLAEGAAVANEVRRELLLQPPPILPVNGLDELSDHCLVVFASHMHELRLTPQAQPRQSSDI